MVPHENVDVARLVMLICPDDGMISHLSFGIWRIGSFVDARQNLDIRPRGFVVRVPFFLIDYKGSAHIFHNGVRRLLHDYGCGGELRDVVGKSDPAHKLGKPWPYTVSVKISEQRGVMKSDPPAPAFLDVFCECGYSCWSPSVGRILQLRQRKADGCHLPPLEQ